MDVILLQAVGQAAGSIICMLMVKGGVKGFKCLKRHYYYMKNMRNNLSELESEEINLSDMEKFVKSKLDMYSKQDQLGKAKSCQLWLVEVEKIKDEIKQLKIEYETVSAKKFLFLIRAMKLGKRLVKVNKKIISLKNHPHQIDLMVEAEPSSVIKKYISKLYSGGFFCACFIPRM